MFIYLWHPFLQASRRHSSSGLSLFGFFIQTDDHQIRSLKYHWIVTINAKMHVWKCKLIFPTDTLQQKIEVTDLNPFLVGTCGLRLLHSTVYIFNTALNKLFTTVMYIGPYHHTVITSVLCYFQPDAVLISTPCCLNITCLRSFVRSRRAGLKKRCVQAYNWCIAILRSWK